MHLFNSRPLRLPAVPDVMLGRVVAQPARCSTHSAGHRSGDAGAPRRRVRAGVPAMRRATFFNVRGGNWFVELPWHRQSRRCASGSRRPRTNGCSSSTSARASTRRELCANPMERTAAAIPHYAARPHPPQRARVSGPPRRARAEHCRRSARDPRTRPASPHDPCGARRSLQKSDRFELKIWVRFFAV